MSDPHDEPLHVHYEDLDVGQVVSLGACAVDAGSLDMFIERFAPTWESAVGAPEAPSLAYEFVVDQQCAHVVRILEATPANLRMNTELRARSIRERHFTDEAIPPAYHPRPADRLAAHSLDRYFQIKFGVHPLK